mmetsp:Transcript_139093/g.352679  ORF Transcript_139093/g.352679 Transcript_139093/m.352679 type:complete len:236 (-) Transcript_139093:1160-1867(-)
MTSGGASRELPRTADCDLLLPSNPKPKHQTSTSSDARASSLPESPGKGKVQHVLHTQATPDSYPSWRGVIRSEQERGTPADAVCQPTRVHKTAGGEGDFGISAEDIPGCIDARIDRPRWGLPTSGVQTNLKAHEHLVCTCEICCLRRKSTAGHIEAVKLHSRVAMLLRHRMPDGGGATGQAAADKQGVREADVLVAVVLPPSANDLADLHLQVELERHRNAHADPDLHEPHLRRA